MMARDFINSNLVGAIAIYSNNFCIELLEMQRVKIYHLKDKNYYSVTNPYIDNRLVRIIDNDEEKNELRSFPPRFV